MGGKGSGLPRNPALAIRMVWFGLTWAVLIYVFIAYLVSQQGALSRTSTLPASVEDASFVIAAAVGLFALGGSHFVGTLLAGRGHAREGAAPGWTAIQRATVLAGAIAEIPAILGLVLFFLGLPFPQLLPFAGASLLCYAVLFFRIQRWIAEQQGDGG